MHIWNVIRAWFSERTEKLGVKETSFPMFLSSKSLEKEKAHVEGFAPELGKHSRLVALADSVSDQTTSLGHQGR